MIGQELQKQIDIIADGPELVVAAAAGVDDRTLGCEQSPDKWCILEILGHLADIEVLYGYRVRQMMADKEAVIAPIDQDDSARNLGYMEAKPAKLLGAYQAARRANVLQAQPVALHLRYLQTLTDIAAEKNSTIIFPIPIDWMSALLGADKE
jgi:hypothetical protein